MLRFELRLRSSDTSVTRALQAPFRMPPPAPVMNTQVPSQDTAVKVDNPMNPRTTMAAAH